MPIHDGDAGEGPTVEWSEGGLFRSDPSRCIHLHTLYLFPYTLLRKERFAPRWPVPSTASVHPESRGSAGLPLDLV